MKLQSTCAVGLAITTRTVIHEVAVDSGFRRKKNFSANFENMSLF